MRRAAAIAVAVIVVAPASGAFAASPAPVLGRRVVVERVSGTVLLRSFHARRFTRVIRPVAAAVGSTVGVTRGKARPTAAEDAQGKKRATGVFYGGRFSFAQRTVLWFAPPAWPSRPRAPRTTSASRSPVKPRPVRPIS
jgi:hypothetical protein